MRLQDSALSDLMSSSSPAERLANITAQMATSTSVFTAALVPQAPEDPLFGLMAAYRRDDSEKKVDLGIGAYRDDNAKPWVLPVVKKVRVSYLYLDELTYSYISDFCLL